MKKLILILLPLSLLAFACSPAQSNSESATTQTKTVQNKQESTATVNLVSPEPQTEIPMGEAEMILEVVDSNGNPVKVESLDVSATMPMEGMEDMMGKVEVTPADEPGRFKATTYFGMQGTWNVVASVQDPQYQAQQEFILEVK
ncbi:FixH family protein [Myxosarcina sp. GI1]|uniref:FixH family protein n=1 Tax=Myxosarcina sp. GI1 TaxID=1541065 RepID=UPI00055EB060|nr:FixH family protein [Myxosarcina sp. GI1]